ncbi:two-component response regulator [Aquipluma nitroreducens]|uniref:Two-component response regulator n=1 Tax=Aquipluma nitroreducens TaxID=2010828 RepID=A0A5K7SGX5_9BACT|nr:response regulator [Aquipluma nitroreducens]BBE20872.1 two-component response regulator [Aquipluma nitroreducens]
MKFKNKILVIDDDPIQSKIIHDILTSQNYDVCLAKNGAMGIQKAFEYNPDLILCDIIMNPIDGYQVYNVLKESSLLDQVPFIFITSNSDLNDIRRGMILGADDYFVKPFKSEELIITIEKRLRKYLKLKEIGKREFNTVFRISPNGIFLFDGNAIINVNPALIEMLGLNSDQLKYKTIEDFIDTVSYLKIEEKINQCSKGILDSFTENVFLKTKEKGLLEACLHISVYERFSSYSLMLGLFTPIQDNSDENDGFLSGVFGKLKKEKMVVNESFERNLTQVLAHPDVKVECRGHGFFSKREIEVLCLSMEGLPMKQIADKLSISDRTVEKHRANLMEKTNSKNMIEVIVFALRNNLIEI